MKEGLGFGVKNLGSRISTDTKKQDLKPVYGQERMHQKNNHPINLVKQLTKKEEISRKTEEFSNLYNELFSKIITVNGEYKNVEEVISNKLSEIAVDLDETWVVLKNSQLISLHIDILNHIKKKERLKNEYVAFVNNFFYFSTGISVTKESSVKDCEFSSLYIKVFVLVSVLYNIIDYKEFTSHSLSKLSFLKNADDKSKLFNIVDYLYRLFYLINEVSKLATHQSFKKSVLHETARGFAKAKQVYLTMSSPRKTRHLILNF